MCASTFLFTIPPTEVPTLGTTLWREGPWAGKKLEMMSLGLIMSWPVKFSRVKRRPYPREISLCEVDHLGKKIQVKALPSPVGGMVNEKFEAHITLNIYLMQTQKGI